jgi:hypothetical protein
MPINCPSLLPRGMQSTPYELWQVTKYYLHLWR